MPDQPMNPICARIPRVTDGPDALPAQRLHGHAVTERAQHAHGHRGAGISPSDHSQQVTFMPRVPERATSAFAFARSGAVHLPRFVEPAVYGQ